MKNVEHIGIAVGSLETAIPLFEKLFNSRCYKRERVESEGVETAFFFRDHSKIELVASLQNDGVIAKFLAKKGEGLHHIAFAVDDIRAEMKRLREQGFVLLSEEPRQGADNKLVCFLHPRDTNGILIEICQDAV